MNLTEIKCHHNMLINTTHFIKEKQLKMLKIHIYIKPWAKDLKQQLIIYIHILPLLYLLYLIKKMLP